MTSAEISNSLKYPIFVSAKELTKSPLPSGCQLHVIAPFCSWSLFQRRKRKVWKAIWVFRRLTPYIATLHQNSVYIHETLVVYFPQHQQPTCSMVTYLSAIACRNAICPYWLALVRYWRDWESKISDMIGNIDSMVTDICSVLTPGECWNVWHISLQVCCWPHTHVFLPRRNYG